MRHGDKLNNLGRTTAHRKALMSNLCCELIQHKRIVTTLAKAKALRGYAEPLITRCKEDNMNNRRVVFSYLQDKEAIKELFGVISDKVADRPGGYTRIIKLGKRAGDAGDSAMIELVDFNLIYGKEVDNADAAAKKTRRGRRGGGKKASVAENTTSETTETVVEAKNEKKQESEEHQEIIGGETLSSEISIKGGAHAENETVHTEEASTTNEASVHPETPVREENNEADNNSETTTL